MKKRISVDPRLSSYRDFFSEKWAKKLDRIDLPRIMRIATLDLVASWKGASIARAMPWLLVNSLASFSRGFQTLDDGFVSQVVTGLPLVLNHELKGSLTPTQMEKLQSAAKQKAIQVCNQRSRMELGFDLEGAWQEFLSSPTFRLSLAASQGMAYTAVYFAYERYLLQCLRVAMKNPTYRRNKRDEKFASDLAKQFGDKVRDECWMNDRIQLARIVRNALAHSGSRVTDELRQKPHFLICLEVVDGEIQILPDDVRRLYALLSQCVLKVTAEFSERYSHSK